MWITTEDASSLRPKHWLFLPDAHHAEVCAKLDHQAPDGRADIVNRYAGMWNDRTMRAQLRLWGVPVSDQAVWRRRKQVSNDSDRYIRTVTCWVYDCEVIAAGVSGVAPSGSMLIQRLESWNQLPYRRLARLAVKTAYALGYDTLQVTMQAGFVSSTADNDSLGVLDEPEQGDLVVHASPVTEHAPGWLRRLYQQRMTRGQMESFGVRRAGLGENRTSSTSLYDAAPVRYGMDCEFVLYDEHRGKILSASYFLPLGGTAGCDAVRMKGKVVYPLMELRPEPAESPEQLVLHLQAAMREADAMIHQSDYSDAVSWLAGAYPRSRLPIGCHIHFSGIPLHMEFIRALDTYAALPLSLFEPDLRRSRRPAYGTFGDVRLQDHEGCGGFEYRTLPNFLYGQELTVDILRLIDIVRRSYPHLHRRDAVDADVQRSFLSGYDRQKYRRAGICALMELTPHCETQKELQSLERIIHLLHSQWTWNEEMDVRPLWLRHQKEV